MTRTRRKNPRSFKFYSEGGYTTPVERQVDRIVFFPSPINSYERFTLELYFGQAKWNKAARNRSCPSSRFVPAVMNRVERSNFHSRDSRFTKEDPWIRPVSGAKSNVFTATRCEPVTSELSHIHCKNVGRPSDAVYTIVFLRHNFMLDRVYKIKTDPFTIDSLYIYIFDREMINRPRLRRELDSNEKLVERRERETGCKKGGKGEENWERKRGMGSVYRGRRTWCEMSNNSDDARG